MLPTYKFGRHIFRPATIEDLPLAQAWNAGDVDHAWERRFPYYWIQQTERANSYVFEDHKGILFFMKSIRNEASSEVEINIQFDRQRKQVSVLRLMMGMAIGFEWLKKSLPMNGFKAVYFVSRNRNLCAFAEKRLGFKHDGHREVYVFKGEGNGKAGRSQTQEVAQV